MLSTWIGELLRIVALLAVFVVPGVLLVYCLMPRTRPLFAVAQAPAWTLGLVTVGTFVVDALPIRWGFVALVGLTVVGALIAFGIRAIIGQIEEQPDFLWRQDGLTLALAVIAGAVTVVPIVTSVNSHGVIQGGDSSYHYAQLWLMEKTGVASPLTANATLRGLDPDPWYYPDTWHAVLSTVATGPESAVTTANLMLVVTPILWFVSIAAFSVALANDSRVGPWAILAGALVPVAASRLQLATTLWPFVLGFVVLPGIMAAILASARRRLSMSDHCRQLGKHVIILSAVFALPVIGLIGIHPSTVVPGGFALFVVSVYSLSSGAWRNYRQQRIHVATRQLAGALLLVYLALTFIHGPGPQRFQFRRFPDVGWDGIVMKLFVSTSLFMPHGGAYALYMYGTVALLTLLSAAYLWRTKRRAMVLAWGANWLLVLGCYVPLFGISSVTSLYYNHPNRAMVGAAMFAVPMMSVTLRQIGELAHQRMGKRHAQSFAVVVVVIAGIAMITAYGAKGLRHDAVSSFEPSTDDVRFLAGPEELDMIARAKDDLPPDSYVMGDPAAGAGLLEPVSNRRVVWAYPNHPENLDDHYLLMYFNSIHWNGRVCDIINRHGITHFYQDLPRYYNGGFTDHLRPGLYNVDTSTGFTEIMRGGEAAIYRIDVCRTNPPTYMPSDDEHQCVSRNGVIACIE
ncbi:MAG: hypothetical protein Q4P71_00980 [Actinomycetaceae bacterium]|nr:hypothetical protein [Actinomycetaceae bacterium]